MIGRLKGRAGKIAYGAGNLGQALIYHMIGTFLIYFYIKEIRLDPALVGVGFSVAYGIWNSINDPIAGYISDRTRTRWGRRIPYVLFGTPLMVIFFTLIWLPPIRDIPLSSQRDIGLFLYFLVVVGVFELLYTFVTVCWNSLFPEMFQDLKERLEVSIYRQVAAMIGLIIGFVVAPQIIYHFTREFGTINGWALTGLVLGCIAGGSFALSLLGSREKKEFSMAGTLPIISAFKITLTNRSFITAAFCILMISWSWSLLAAISPFFVEYFLGGTIADITFISAPILLMAIVFYPFWRKIGIKYGTKKTLITSYTLETVFVLLFVLVADNVIEAAAVMIFYGITNSGVNLVREILIPDVIDEDEVKTGFRREGIYLGVTTFIDRFALGLTGISTVIIFSLSGFTPGSTPPSPTIILNMRVLTAALFTIALACFLIAMKFYPLSADKVDEVRGALEKLHRERGIV
ncbi:putative symporter YjmB [Candidatus Calditenuaceae archaeon HR02]|nr:putative symporter YjmB [Candidatus Calditenuaceae archaeon HR02]